MLKVVVGHSNDPDSDLAIAEILQQCDRDLAGNRPQAGILITAIGFEHTVMVEQINLTYPGIELIGCTSVGEMSSVLQFQQDSATLMLFCADEIDIRAGIARNLSQDTIVATASAIEQARTDKPPRLCLTLSESIGVNGTSIAQGLQQAVGEGVTVFGGLAGDDWQFESTYQFFGTEVVQDAAVILLFSGDLLVSCAVATGQFPVSKQGVATKTMDKSILEIDGKPASEFYFDYFGEIPLGGGAALGGSLAVFEPNGRNFYLRAPSGNDSETGAVHFFGEIPEQSIIQLTQTDESAILSAAEKSLTTAKNNYPGTSPAAAVIVSCSSRLKNLGVRAAEEHQMVQTLLGENLPNIGFYAFGEISPFSSDETTYLHNETFLTLLIGTN